MKSGFIGMLLVFGLIMLAIALGGGNGFFNVPSLVICIGLPIGLSLASAGASDTRNALRALRSLLVLPPPGDFTARNS
jgi:flagellar motor component MotA